MLAIPILKSLYIFFFGITYLYLYKFMKNLELKIIFLCFTYFFILEALQQHL